MIIYDYFRYTYGKPMRGSTSVTIKLQFRPWESQPQEERIIKLSLQVSDLLLIY